jgi:subtilisin family serine protease
METKQMRKKLSLITMKILFGITMFDQSAAALMLNGKKVDFTANSNDLKKIKTRSLSDRYKTIIAKFNTPLTKELKEKFYSSGVSSIVYAGDLSYYFYAKESVLDHLDFSDSDFVAKTDMKSEYRMKDESGLSTLGSEDYQNFNILFLEELTAAEVKNYLENNGVDAVVLKALPELKQAQVQVSHNDLEKLKNLELIQYMDRSQSMKTVHGEKISRNSVTAKNIHVSTLWGGSYNLNGENMSVGIVDGGVVRATHQEFNKNGCGRVYVRSNVDTNFHATHVAGTIAAEGDKSDARGMANRAKIYSYGFTDVAFAESFLKLYRNDGVLLSNHSYGYNDKIRLGEYDSEAATQDRAVSNNPFLNVFEAAGNDGKDDRYGDFGIIKGPGNSKNVFTIGALNITSSSVAELSSTGPVIDGRIKPDLCARGEYVRSSTDESDHSYATMSGTSMASPAATGAATLIAQQYKRTTGGFDIRHDILKSIMINTAVDKENPGPDYKVGFGMINAQEAVDVVKTIGTDDTLVSAGRVAHGGKKVYDFKLTENSPFKTTISWVDVESNPASSTTLVNDIDMLLVNKTTGAVYYPYTLDKNNPNASAKADKANRVDNIEQIEVSNLPKGDYQLQITGHTIVTNSQEFAIASNIALFGENSIETLRPSQLRCFAKTIHREIL